MRFGRWLGTCGVPNLLAPAFLAPALVVLAFLALTDLAPARAQDVPKTARIAIAANFIAPGTVLIAAFEKENGQHIDASFGASGQFLNQIRNGAPYDAFLSADETRPETLLREGLAVAGSGFTYATGQLALWSGDPKLVAGEAALRTSAFRHLAICNPQAAPYGAAAEETLRRLGLLEALRPRLVVGADVAQAWQFARSGNAEMGFVAYSQVKRVGTGGTVWIVPETLHAPIRQEAVLLTHGQDNATARAFLTFLHGTEARAVMRQYGYTVP